MHTHIRSTILQPLYRSTY